MAEGSCISCCTEVRWEVYFFLASFGVYVSSKHRDTMGGVVLGLKYVTVHSFVARTAAVYCQFIPVCS